MELTYAQVSLVGPVRPHNEDYIRFWEPPEVEERRSRGAVAMLADGVGGHGHGEVASRLAVETALQTFRAAKPGVAPSQLLAQMFNAANLAVYDAGMKDRAEIRMATTLTISVFRNNEVTIGHVGDCRVYLIQDGRVKRLTADHSYVAGQVKLGLISEQEALSSEMRSILTRCIGRDPLVQMDTYHAVVNRGDCLIQCSDGLYCHITEQELLELLSREPLADACRRLTDLAEKRGTTDNLSIQAVQVQRVEQLIYYRGVPVYQEAPDLAMTHEIQIGDTLDDRFKITGVVARSGMASIYKATDLQTGRTTAIKIPSFQLESDPAFYSRFEREEAIGKSLDHRYILHILPIEGPKSRPYIAMEYLEGQTLRQMLNREPSLPVSEALHIASRLCEALDHMHQRDVVHRDLKPENVMVCNDGTLRIMDFGIAKAAGMRRLTFTGFSSAMGTPDYMAPEQVKGKRGDARTDLYSLGAMLYEMITGAPPFEGTTPYVIMNARLTGDPMAPRKRKPEISPQVEEILLHALERDPADRYQTAAEFKAELDNPEGVTLTGRHERLRPPSAAGTAWHSFRLVIIGVLIPIVIFGLMFLIFRFPWAAH